MQNKPFVSEWAPIEFVLADFRLKPTDLKSLIQEKTIRTNGISYDDYCPTECEVGRKRIGKNQWKKSSMQLSDEGILLFSSQDFTFGKSLNPFMINTGYIDIEINTTDLEKFVKRKPQTTPRSCKPYTRFLTKSLNQATAINPQLTFEKYLRHIEAIFYATRDDYNHPIIDLVGSIEDGSFLITFNNIKLSQEMLRKIYNRNKPVKQIFN